MKNIELNIEKALPFIDIREYESLISEVDRISASLENNTCAGSDFLGWLHLPSSITKEMLDDIKSTAAVLQENCDVVVVS